MIHKEIIKKNNINPKVKIAGVIVCIKDTKKLMTLFRNKTY